MVDAAPSRITRYGGNRHCLYLRSELVGDSAFPFQPSDDVLIRIEGERLIVERMPAGSEHHGRQGGKNGASRGQ